MLVRGAVGGEINHSCRIDLIGRLPVRSCLHIENNDSKYFCSCNLEMPSAKVVVTETQNNRDGVSDQDRQTLKIVNATSKVLGNCVVQHDEREGL